MFAESEGTPRSRSPAQRFGQRLRVQPQFCAATFSGSKSRPLPQMVSQATARDYSRSLDSSFELVVLIDVCGPIMPVNGNDHCEANGCLGCGNGDGKDCDHHAG